MALPAIFRSRSKEVEQFSDTITTRPHEQQARMDPCFIEQEICEMRIGQIGWIVPWAIQIDYDGYCWLDPHFTIHDRPFGTAQVKVARGQDGFYALYPRGHKLNRRDIDAKRMIPLRGIQYL